MSWTKLDDRFWSHPKVVDAGNEAVGVYARMLSYCGGHLTDGHVPGDIARFLGRSAALKRLLETKLIVRRGDDFEVYNYLEYNPTREAVEEDRRKNAERQARWRNSQRNTVTNGVSNDAPYPYPSRPEKRTGLGTGSQGENGVGATSPEEWSEVVE